MAKEISFASTPFFMKELASFIAFLIIICKASAEIFNKEPARNISLRFSSIDEVLPYYNGHLAKSYADIKAIHVLANNKRFPINRFTTFEALGLDTDNIVNIPAWALELFSVGPTLDVRSKTFLPLAKAINSSIHARSRVPTIDRIFVPTAAVLETLVVIYGNPANFGLTCARIFNHIVVPNLPARVVLSFDVGAGYELDRSSSSCLQSLGAPVTILRSGGNTCTSSSSAATATTAASRDLCLIELAVKSIDSNSNRPQQHSNSNNTAPAFGYMVVAHADQFFKADVRAAPTLGAHPSFFRSFISFENVLEVQFKLKLRRGASYHDRVLCWMVCGGIKEAIPSFVQALSMKEQLQQRPQQDQQAGQQQRLKKQTRQQQNNFTPQDDSSKRSSSSIASASTISVSCQQRLRDHVNKLPDSLYLRSKKGNYFTYQEAVAKAMQHVAASFKVVFHGHRQASYSTSSAGLLFYGPYQPTREVVQKLLSSATSSETMTNQQDSSGILIVELPSMTDIADAFTVEEDVDTTKKTKSTLAAAAPTNTTTNRVVLEAAAAAVTLLTPPVKPTLIIIYGEYRSFDLTCPSIFDHIVLPNLPARVILSIDSDSGFELGVEAMQCMQPHRNITTVLRARSLCSAMKLKEFCFVEEAMRLVESSPGFTNDTYGYVIKVRADNYIGTDIHVSAAYGAHPSFHERYELFERDLVLEYKNRMKRSPTFQERVWGWLFCGGISRMIIPMLFRYNGAAWSRVSAVQWNTNIREYIGNMTNTITDVPIPPEESSSSSSLSSSSSFSDQSPHLVSGSGSSSRQSSRKQYENAVLQTILNVTSTFKIVYLIGSTWIHFGPFSLVREESRDILRYYGTLTWETGPQSGVEAWKDVHESQVRLVHRIKGWNLIGLESMADYKTSFNSTQRTGLIEEMSDPTLVAWLVRLCDRRPRHPVRKEC